MHAASENQYYIDVWFNGRVDPVSFRVGQEDVGRFQGDYQNDRDSFFVCATVDKTVIAINLKQVEMAHLRRVTGAAEDNDVAAGAWLAIHTLNRQPYLCSTADLQALAQVFLLFESAVTVPREVIPLNDHAGQLVMFDPAAVLYIEALGSAVAEGKRLLYAKERQSSQ
ncbi:MAG TPA: hypothetical protein GXZ82_13985 [Firmicutes bacterium]|jgi:hypothetical protein|nr:hypothetical protein [Bacillota bacterium]